MLVKGVVCDKGLRDRVSLVELKKGLRKESTLSITILRPTPPLFRLHCQRMTLPTSKCVIKNPKKLQHQYKHQMLFMSRKCE